MSDQNVNSESYWNSRFKENWEQAQGRIQSRFFSLVALNVFPKWLRAAIRGSQWSMADWGCAEGDGTQLLSENLCASIVGIDFAEEAIIRARIAYPNVKFEVANWLDDDKLVEDTYDVVFSSNTLEHFHSPWTVFDALAARAKRFVVLLLPYREIDRHFEHFASFFPDSVLFDKREFTLVGSYVVNTAQIPDTQWPGEQILLIYGKQQAVGELGLCLADLTFDVVDPEEQLQWRMKSERLAGEIALLERKISVAEESRREIETDRSAWTGRAMAAERDIAVQREAYLELHARWEAAELQAKQLHQEHVSLKRESLQQRAQFEHQEALFVGRLSGLENAVAALTAQLQGKAKNKIIQRLARTRAGRVVGRVRRDGILRTGLYAASRLYRRGAMNWYMYQFAEFRQARDSIFGSSWRMLKVPVQQKLVTIVLPCFNGEDMVAESIDSVLSQTYKNFELLLVNDGSSDHTGEIFDGYARRDPRVRVFHQENRRLPRTLSRGFRESRGEYLTWTSADNRMKPDCLERLVEAFERDPDLDMVYANIDIIGPDGSPLKNSDWYSNYQKPAGSEHIAFPENTAELNTWANNFIGACFMYRARVAHMLRDYSAVRFCTEDYDYWMRINALFKLRHLGIEKQLYEYRFHPNSLTSRDKELRITENRDRLMIFEDFRRSFLLSPGIWILDCLGISSAERSAADALKEKLLQNGHRVFTPDEISSLNLASRWTPMAYVCFAENVDQASPRHMHDGAVNVLVAIDEAPLSVSVDGAWAWCVALGDLKKVNLPKLDVSYQGWAGVGSIDQLYLAIDVLAKEHQLALIEQEAEYLHWDKPKDILDATIVICTYRRSECLPLALRSAAEQTVDRSRYEIIVVNNDPDEPHPSYICDEIKAGLAHTEGDVFLRLIDCPIPGLSHARNAGIAASRGRIVLFLDDDAIARSDCLEHLLNAYDDNPRVGVVGGHIQLDPPAPVPEVLKPGREALWSHFVTGNSDFSVVQRWYEFPWGANWSARREALYGIGGFRTNFGRIGNDYGGGEEIVAAVLIQKLGFDVAVEPRAVVLHRVERKRFTEEHVTKTIVAGVMSNYQMQKSMYLPFEASLVGTTKAVLLDLVARLRDGVLRRSGGERDTLVSLAQRQARRRLWCAQIADRLSRRRKSFVSN